MALSQCLNQDQFWCLVFIYSMNHLTRIYRCFPCFTKSPQLYEHSNMCSPDYLCSDVLKCSVYPLLANEGFTLPRGKRLLISQRQEAADTLFCPVFNPLKLVQLPLSNQLMFQSPPLPIKMNKIIRMLIYHSYFSIL